MKYFEDFEVGDRETLPGRTVSKEEIFDFARAYDPQPHHLDEDAAKASILGTLSASGWHNCCSLNRMIIDHEEGAVAYLGSPGIEESRWRRPVLPGDTLAATSEILEVRPSGTDGDAGLVKTRYEMTKQTGEVVLTTESWALIARRPRGEPGEAK